MFSNQFKVQLPETDCDYCCILYSMFLFVGPPNFACSQPKAFIYTIVAEFYGPLLNVFCCNGFSFWYGKWGGPTMENGEGQLRKMGRAN